jgi:hypothetical protein
MQNLSAKWVLKCLIVDQERQRCHSSEQLLDFFFVWHHPNDFLSQLVTTDETWLSYHYDPKTKQQSMEWRHSGSPRPQKFAGKFLASICWDQDGILLIPKGQTIIAEYY